MSLITRIISFDILPFTLQKTKNSFQSLLGKLKAHVVSFFESIYNDTFNFKMTQRHNSMYSYASKKALKKALLGHEIGGA
jgi:hypothetical protein